MDDSIELRCCHGVLVVRPGDQLVIAATLNPEEANAYAKDLATQLPGINFVVLNGAVQLAVNPSGP